MSSKGRTPQECAASVAAAYSRSAIPTELEVIGTPTPGPTSTTPTQLPQVSATESSAAQNPQLTNAVVKGSGGLSEGQKIAIGISIPFGVIALGLASCVFWLQRRKRQEANANGEVQDKDLAWEVDAEETKLTRTEFEKKRLVQAVELDAQTEPQELGLSHRLSGTSGWPLPGDLSRRRDEPFELPDSSLR